MSYTVTIEVVWFDNDATTFCAFNSGAESAPAAIERERLNTVANDVMLRLFVCVTDSDPFRIRDNDRFLQFPESIISVTSVRS